MIDGKETIAILIPCYNEEIAISSVVKGFQSSLPDATIYVYDNNSTDSTAVVAARAGAVVRTETMQGKGNVVRRMFADIEADVYILVDGDGTYDSTAAPKLVRTLLDNQLDMVVGVRRTGINTEAYPSGHTWGNMAFNRLFSLYFSDRFTDIFSGYRGFSRRYVKSFPSLSSGFEIETEMSTHAFELKLPTQEIETTYFPRPEGSYSKLNTYRDGLHILMTIIRLYKDIFPFYFFGLFALFGFLTGIILGVPVITEFLRTGLVSRFPTAILATGIMIVSSISFVCGVLLSGVTRGRLEQKRLWYLSTQYINTKR